MMERVVYVLAGGSRDIYSSMTRISMASLRLTNPSVKAIVVTDSLTGDALKTSRDPLLEEADEFIFVAMAGGPPSFRSRFLKTSVHNIVGGRLIFLDSDTLVRTDISDLFALSVDVACSANHSRDNLNEQRWDENDAILEAMNWKIRDDIYVNSGVLFFNDTPGAVRLSSDWHEKWHTAFAATNDHHDQPALNAAIYDLKPRLLILPHDHNAQFRVSPWSATGAAIWHYYATLFDSPTTEFELLTRQLLEGAKLSRAVIRNMVRRSHPWRRKYWLDDFIANRMIKRGDPLTGYYRLWFEGHRISSVVQNVRDKARLNLRITKAH